MSNDEIIEMARQAGWPDWEIVGMKGELKTFAKLVADVATAKEREACAKVSEEKGLSWKTRRDINPDNAEKAYMASQFIADAIRTRGEA